MDFQGHFTADEKRKRGKSTDVYYFNRLAHCRIWLWISSRQDRPVLAFIDTMRIEIPPAVPEGWIELTRDLIAPGCSLEHAYQRMEKRLSESASGHCMIR